MSPLINDIIALWTSALLWTSEALTDLYHYIGLANLTDFWWFALIFLGLLAVRSVVESLLD